MKPGTTGTITGSPESHTPAPWTYHPEPLFNGMHVAGRGPTVRAGVLRVARVERISASASRKRDEEGEANARLMSAAPDLLAACKLVNSRSSGARDTDAYAEISWDVLDAIDAAIVKATGIR